MKSYNVLVTRDYSVVKICDFGVSVPLTKTLEIDTSTDEFMYIGTQCWSSPEVISGKFLHFLKIMLIFIIILTEFHLTNRTASSISEKLL